MPALGSVYGLGYFPQARHGARAVRLQLYFGLVTGAMALVVASANGILFLAAWEVMALGGFLLVLTDHEEREAQRAAFVYLTSAHAANLALFAMFVLLAGAAGSYDFAAMVGLPARGGPATAIFALALCGFGLKAGLLPLHFWLPGAHAAAPSHVSALMSGVLLKTGIYGLLRVTGFFEAPPAAWGTLLLVLRRRVGGAGRGLRAGAARPEAAAGLPLGGEHRDHRHGRWGWRSWGGPAGDAGAGAPRASRPPSSTW